jgi:hypothetical protein
LALGDQPSRCGTAAVAPIAINIARGGNTFAAVVG